MPGKFCITRRRLVVALLCLFALLALPFGLFAVNGALLAWGETPRTGTTAHPPASVPEKGPAEVKILAFNVAKGFVHQGGLRFSATETVSARMKKIADRINEEKPDLVFLSEIVFECTPCPVNQVVTLAEATGMHAWVFGENYNFGLPFYRIVGGNAILSRWPLEPVTNESLAGRKPFYVTHNNRRALWAAVTVGGRRVLLASLHNDSFSRTNNLTQTRQLLDYAGERPVILAGDFNARPTDESIKVIQKSGRFSGAIEGPNTFPAHKPDRRIDFIFAPSDWELIEHHVPECDASDHLPVVSTFRTSG
jgi:endonuclease/exonuclease/phosphatase family metal-dependent hydrolase